MRWLPDGELDFLGRIDSQIKIRGYRIELEAVEALKVALGVRYERLERLLHLRQLGELVERMALEDGVQQLLSGEHVLRGRVPVAHA